MSYVTRADSTPVHRAAALVAEFHNGITIDEIAARLGLSLAHTKNIMSGASRFGLCKPAQDVTRCVLWFTPALAIAFKLKGRAARLERRREQGRTRARRDRLEIGAGGKTADPYQLRDLADAPECRRVAANDVPPPFTRGVRSVFDLGAAA